VARLSRRQLGLITTAQANELGITNSMIHRRVRRGLWERRLPAVYALRCVPPSRDQAVLAAALWCGPAALVASETALAVHGLLDAGRTVHLLGPEELRRRRPGIEVHHSSMIVPADRARVRGIPVTSVARSLADAARQLGPEASERVLEEALRRRLLTIPRLAAVHERLSGSGHAGCRIVRTLLADRDIDWVPLQRELERRTYRLLRRAGLPDAVRQLPVRLDGFTAHVDFAWPIERVVLEVDGWGPHSGRRMHHLDRDRWSALTTARWRVIVAGWDHVVDQPDVLVGRVRHLLATPPGSCALQFAVGELEGT